MIEVEDKSGTNICLEPGTGTPDTVLVSRGGRCQMAFHKDTWPALKTAVEKTIQQLEAKPYLQHSDRDQVESLIYLSLKGSYMPPDIMMNILDALERGYV